MVESIIQRLMDLKPILSVAFSPHEREDAHEVAGVGTTASQRRVLFTDTFNASGRYSKRASNLSSGAG